MSLGLLHAQNSVLNLFYFLAVTFAIWRERLGPGRHPRAPLSLLTGDRSRECHALSSTYLYFTFIVPHCCRHAPGYYLVWSIA